MPNDLHFGVAVGINRYPELTPLNYARSDAARFAEWLLDPDGGKLPPQNVVTIVVNDETVPDGTPRDQAVPRKEDVFKALYDFRKKAEVHVEQHPEDWEKTRLYYYVSGHGIAPGARDSALLMANAGPDWFGENVACSGVITFFAEVQSFKEIVLFADCCQERVSSAPLGEPPWTRVQGNNGNVVKCIGYATYFGDYAYEPDPDDARDPDELRGYFTRALIEGLEGKAARGRPRIIDSTGLGEYIRDRVMTLTEHCVTPQEPTMATDPGNPIVFRRDVTRPPDRYTVNFEFETAFAGVFELLDGRLKTVGQFTTAAPPWSCSRENGIYRVVAVGGGVEFNDDGYFSVFGEDRHVKL